MSDFRERIQKLMTGITGGAAEKSSCPSCSDAKREECDNGWFFTEVDSRRLAHRCPGFRRALAVQANAYALETLRQTWAEVRDWPEIEVNHQSWRLAKTYAENVRELIEGRVNLCLIGPRGTGKTNAALLVGGAALKAGYRFVGIRLARLAELMRHSYAEGTDLDEHRLMDAFRTADLVLVDEVLGVEFDASDKPVNRAHELRILDDLLQGRYEEGKPTMLTANLKHSELEALLGERSAQRFFASCDEIAFNGAVYRTRVGRERAKPLIESIHKLAERKLS